MPLRICFLTKKNSHKKSGHGQVREIHLCRSFGRVSLIMECLETRNYNVGLETHGLAMGLEPWVSSHDGCFYFLFFFI